MALKNSHSGFVLCLTLVLLLCASVTLGAVLYYTAFTLRYVRHAQERHVCLAAAQSSLEQLKGEIKRKYSDSVSQASVRVGVANISQYEWFQSVINDQTTIGVGVAPYAVMRAAVCDTQGCHVTLRIELPNVESANSCTLTLLATAITPRGVSVTVRERICFASRRSSIYNYAYFVNNYGWMNGASIVINGDMRANGDMSITGSVVNGKIYAAKNDEVGADGEISFAPVASRSGRSTTYTYPKIWSQDYYWQNAGERARPTNPAYADGAVLSGGFSASDSTITLTDSSLSDSSDAGYSYLLEDAGELPMPYVSDLKSYREYAQALQSDPEAANAYLKYNAVSFDASGNPVLGARKTLNVCNYTQDDNDSTPTVNEMILSGETGLSGDASGGDQGTLVLVGTKTNPIKIDGPVIVASDVVIMGYVTGQGTIYSGRNIHVVGDITYLDGPSWPHPDSTPETTRASNVGKDMLSLVAKGCVVVGNCADASWKSSIEPYISSDSSSNVSKEYYCNDDDTSIGYPASTEKFSGDYTAACSQKKYYDCAWCVPVTVQSTDDGSTWSYVSYSSTPVLRSLTNPYSAVERDLSAEQVADGASETTRVRVRSGRSYTYVDAIKKTIYEVIGNTSATYYSKWKNKVSSWGQYANENARYYDTLCGDTIIDYLARYGNKLVYGKSAGVACIDAVLYDNHGTFGLVGRSGYDFTLNGSLICRDEALVGVSGIRNMVFNWDIRLKEDSSEGVNNEQIGMPVDSCTPQTLSWQIVPDDWNLNFKGTY